MSIKARIEAIIYAAEEPVTFAQLFSLVKEEAHEECLRLRARAAEAAAEASQQRASAVLPTFATADDPVEPFTPADESAFEAPAAEPASQPGADTGEAGEPDSGSEPCATEPEPVETANTVSDAELKTYVRTMLEELTDDFATEEHGIEVRQIAGGYRMATKPEQHDAVRSFAKSLKPPIRLSMQALETLAVIAYKQPITAPEISEVRGVDAGGVLGTLLDRKLITTSGRKQVIGRPILYKTTKEFLLRFGLKDVNELPSMEEFEKLAAESLGPDLFTGPAGKPADGETKAAPPSVLEAEESAAELDAELESADVAAASAEAAAFAEDAAAASAEREESSVSEPAAETEPAPGEVVGGESAAERPVEIETPKPVESGGEAAAPAPASPNQSGPSES